MNENCQKCGSKLQVFPGICPSCGAVNTDTYPSRDTSQYVRPGGPGLLSYPLAKPWPRFFARTFDIWIEFAFLFGFIYLYSIFISSDLLNFYLSNSFISGALLFPIIFIIDAAIYSVFGNTPGKFMLGLKVGNMHGNKLGFFNYLKRNGYVWLLGYWLGLPVLGVPMILQWNRIKKGKQAAYDEIMGTRVWAKPIGLVRQSVFACLIVSMFGLIFVVIVKNDNDKNSYIANNAKTYFWTNPLTNKKIKITDNWKIETKINQEGQTYWRFVNSSGRSFEVLGVEQIPSITIWKYADNYLKVMEPTTQFDSGGHIYNDHGMQVWKGAGHMIGKKYIKVQLVIAQKGHEFWRIVIFRAIPKDRVWSDTTSLESKLLSTI